jgi:hypothetical protein
VVVELAGCGGCGQWSTIGCAAPPASPAAAPASPAAAAAPRALSVARARRTALGR